MPWTNSDNAFSWLEITRRCDLQCEYCYQTNDPQSDKTLAEIKLELQTLLSLRRCDTMFISGGEPLLHPRLAEIVTMVRDAGVKPMLVTNGHCLNAATIGTLKRAGLLGFILHVDRGQARPGWTDATEKQLNQLRQHLVDLIHSQRGLLCGFNTTILPETLHEVPDIVSWTVKNIHKVCANTLIPVRVPRHDDPWDLEVRGQKIAFEDTVFSSRTYKNPSKTNLTARDIHDQVRIVLPGFTGNAFLGGTEVPEAPKWLFSNILGTGKLVIGHLGPRTIEILQNGYHLIRNRFLSFLKPSFYGRGKWLLVMGVIDREVRKAAASFLAASIKSPGLLFRRVSVQSLLILQPQDVLPDGRQDLCDGCPNRTLHAGRLVPVCRKEEYLRFGDVVTLTNRGEPASVGRSAR